MASRRLLQTTGAVYYGTATFNVPLNLYGQAPLAAAPPGYVATGYDFTCLVKDIRATNCSGKPLSVWSVMTSICVVVMVFCIVLIPIACIYRTGRSAGRSMHKMFGANRENPYQEVEDRAARNSVDMPVPPTTSVFRNNHEVEEEPDWE